MRKPISRGLPAAAVLAGGISRHGASCGCRYCSTERQPIAVIPLSSIDDSSIDDTPQPLREDDAITAAYEAARKEIESKRIEHVGGEWSPAQHAWSAV